MPDYQDFLQRCHELAAQAAAAGNTSVGSVVVRDGIIIGEGKEAGRSKRDVTCHAEIEAIRDVVRRTGEIDLSDCILVTTHEPCVMCSYVIRFHGISTVLYEQAVPTVGGINSKFPVLTDDTFWGGRAVPQVRQVKKE